jgi:serine/threonine-protein kinase
VLLPPVIFPTYAIPKLTGLSVSDAATHARPHFKVVVHHERVTDAAVGVVLAQAPAATTHHRPGSITIDVSDGNALAPVPDLTGLTTAAAVNALRAAHFVPVQSTPAFSTTVTAGTVISWTPRGQAAVRDVVQIVTSRGAEFVTMPDLVTVPMSADQAVAQLVQLGIPASAISQKQDFNDTVPVGDVIATTPQAGQQADRAGTVALDVSKGPDVVPVPDVRGRSVSTAEARLRQAGFVPQTYGPPGASIVVDQQPLPGTSIKRGSQVLLVAF